MAKCLFCEHEIVDDNPICPNCGRRQRWIPNWKPENEPASTPSGAKTDLKAEGQSLSQDTGWKCKNCGNFNVRTDKCSNCGKERGFVPQQSSTPAETPKQSKADEYYQKGMKAFLEIFGESDKNKVSGHLARAQGYLTMAYKAAGDKVEEKKGIAGLMAFILTDMNDYKNAELWARSEIAINPGNVFARLATYQIELNKLVGHKGFLPQDDGSGFGTVMSILSVGVDVARVKGKENAVKTAAIEAAKAIDNRTRTESEPNPGLWLIWSMVLLSIIENMWANKMKEKYLCEVLLNLPWNRFPDEEIKDIQDAIEEIQVEAHGYLGRLN